jgi:hypothetical protein
MAGLMFFHDLSPAIGLDETRTLTILQQGDGELPPDGFAFLELYCVDPGCDCRGLRADGGRARPRPHSPAGPSSAARKSAP